MKERLASVNKRFIKQSIFLFIAVIAISFVGVVVTGVSAMKNANQWGMRTAESLMLREMLFIEKYERAVEQVAYSIEQLYKNDNEMFDEWSKEYTKNMLGNFDYKEYGMYAYINGEFLWDDERVLNPNYNPKERPWYTNAIEKNGKVSCTGVYRDTRRNKEKISVSKMLNDGESVVSVDIYIDDIDMGQDIYEGEFIGSQTIVDKDGNVIYHRPLGNIDDVECEFENYTSEDFKSLLSNFEGDSGNVMLETETGKTRYYYYVDDNGWTSFVSIDYHAITNDATQLFIVIITLSVVFMLVIIYLCFLNYKDAKSAVKTIGYFEKLGNTYYAVVLYDIEQDICTAIKAYNKIDRGREYRTYDEFKIKACEVIEDNYKLEFQQKFTVDNLNKLLKGEIERCYMEYKRIFDEGSKWVSLEVFTLDHEKSEVLFAFKEIHSEKVANLEQQKLLEESLEISKNAAQAKSDFLSRMSHDMRTPMNAVIGFAGIAENNIENHDKVKDCLVKIIAASKQLLHLLNEILDMAKIEQGKMNINKSNVNILEHICETADMFKVQCDIQQKDFEFKHNEFKHHIINADILRLEQILNNILSNAVKYTEPGGKITFEVIENPIDNGNSLYKFIISDTGIGMSENFMKKLFTPFEREETSMTGKVNGVGLGMAIVKNTVQVLGGQIDVKSKLGEGSVFTVIIPCEVVDNKEFVDEESMQVNENDDVLSGKRFLIVEDNVLNMEIAREILEIEGVETVPAYNGQEAFEIFNEKDDYYFDAILMDIQMPVLDGYGASKKIRSVNTKYAKNIPIIAMTANAFADDVIKSSEAGMNAHISKPVDYNKLKEILADIFEKNSFSEKSDE